MTELSLTVVIPALDEEKGLSLTLDAVRRGVAGAPIVLTEIVVVDDGSTDATAEIASRHGAKVIRHAQSLGYGRSLKDGIRAAQGSWILITDADGTYPVAEALPALLAGIQQGFDMVVGARKGPHYRQGFGKSLLRSILRLLVEFTTGRSIEDINSGLRIFRKETVEGYLPHLSDTFSFTTSLTLAYQLTGRSIQYRPIDYHQRKGSSKVRLFRDSLRTLQFIAQAMAFYNPIKLYLLLAGASFLGVSGAAILGAAISPWLAIPFAVAAATGALALAIGFASDLIRQLALRR